MTVREVVITGVIGRWFHRRGWRGLTLPTITGKIKIRYWYDRDDGLNPDLLSEIDPDTRAHEHTLHVPQIRELGRLRYLYKYAKLWLEGYYVCRRWMHLTRKESARCAYRFHPMEHENWRENV